MATSPSPRFSPDDANAIIALVRSAPLQNLAVAEHVAALLQKFADHCQRHFAPTPEPDLGKDTPVAPPAQS